MSKEHSATSAAATTAAYKADIDQRIAKAKEHYGADYTSTKNKALSIGYTLEEAEIFADNWVSAQARHDVLEDIESS